MKTYSKILKGIIYDNYVELGRGGGGVYGLDYTTSASLVSAGSPDADIHQHH